jgi:hypothetical protein
MMTKKHYEGIAEALAEAQARDVVINGLAAFFAKDNPKFSEARFKSLAKIDERSPEGKRRAALREMADEQHGEEGGIEIDGDAATSEGDDNGSYVAAWLWVDFAETPFDKEADRDAKNNKAFRELAQEGAAKLKGAR